MLTPTAWMVREERQVADGKRERAQVAPPHAGGVNAARLWVALKLSEWSR